MASSNKSGKRGDDYDSDPEERAEIEYAKEHGLPVRPKNDSHVDIAQEKMKKSKSLDVTTEAPIQENGVVKVPRCQKNQRKSRTGRSRALPKAGGGGKGIWGKVGGLYEEAEYLDDNDPNYDSDDQVENVKYVPVTLTESDVRRVLDPIIDDFLANGDIVAAVDSLNELSMSAQLRSSVIRTLISKSIDHKASQRELTSVLLSELVHQRILFKRDVDNAFRLLLTEDINELVVDFPASVEVVGNFIARAVADEALAANFMAAEKRHLSTSSGEGMVVNGDAHNGSGDVVMMTNNGDNPTSTTTLPSGDSVNTNQNATEALERAELMLRNKRRLDNIWGIGGSNRPVRFLANEIKTLLEEFLSSGDLKEAETCLAELEVPHFHHEVVYQAGVLVIEAMHERPLRLLSTLLGSLYDAGIVTMNAVQTGFERLYGALPDLCLDVPPAYTLLERWVKAGVDKGYVGAALAKSMPTKGRKRFLSEGDGGKFSVLDVPHPYI